MTLRLAVLGAGAMGARVAALADTMDGFAVTAVVDPDGERAARAAAPLGAAALPALADAIAGGVADAVYVGTPHHLHEPACLEAAQAGMHLLVDKPLCNDLAESRRIADARDRAGVTLMVGFSYRFRAEWRRAREWIAAGRIGTPLMVSDTLFESHGTTPAWYWIRSAGGGVLQLQSHHCFDRTAWILGDAFARVSCRAATRTGDEVETAVVVSAETRGGAQLGLAIGFGRGSGDDAQARTVIQGELGHITIDSVARIARLHGGDGAIEEVSAAGDDWLATELDAFRRACAGDGPPVPGVAEGVAALECAVASAVSSGTAGSWTGVGHALR